MLHGLEISDFLSIGEPQQVSPLGKINLFVGPNNAGKSNVLRFLNENLSALAAKLRGEGQSVGLQSQPNLRRAKPSAGRICIAPSVQAVQGLLAGRSGETGPLIAKLFEKLAPNGELWIDEKWPSKGMVSGVVPLMTQREWQLVWREATKQSGGGLEEHWIPEVLRRLRELIPPCSSVYAIPVARQADATTNADASKSRAKLLSGRGIIVALAALQNPRYENFDDDRRRFENIEEFVRTVTDDASASISVSHKQDEILVRMRGQRMLPLSSLGSGIEQVVLHAVAATSVSESIVTFEEPELHLHPVLQRQLIYYLANTANQYFISTHSAHLIDALHANTFHVRLIQEETRIEAARTDAQRHKICLDLGYRPSDIVQSNCVIWVEGPSDREYLKHWLFALDPHLREQVHYSIMFYGGKLLSHLSAGDTDEADDTLQELIQLRWLNRQVALVIDSDRKTIDMPLRDTKLRIADEVQQSGGFVWITLGREIENYVPGAILCAAVESVAEGRGLRVQSGQFDKALPSVKEGSKTSVDKVEVARKVSTMPADLSQLDLRQQITGLANFIRNANGLVPISSDQ